MNLKFVQLVKQKKAYLFLAKTKPEKMGTNTYAKNVLNQYLKNTYCLIKKNEKKHAKSIEKIMLMLVKSRTLNGKKKKKQMGGLLKWLMTKRIQSKEN